MKNLIAYLIGFLIFPACVFAAHSDVQSIHYLSKKTSTMADQTIVSEMSVWLSSENVRISYTVPEKRNIVLRDNLVSIFSDGEDLVTYDYKDTPFVVRQILVPSIFAAGSFMQNLGNGFDIKKLKADKGVEYYRAESKRKKNISGIDYTLDVQTKALLSYKMYHTSGALMSEVVFSDYKLFAERFLLPLKITTRVTLKDGVLEETEVFSRVKVNQPIPAAVFTNNFQ